MKAASHKQKSLGARHARRHPRFPRHRADIPANTTLHLTATHEKSLGPLSSARLEARINNTLIASARMTFHLTIE